MTPLESREPTKKTPHNKSEGARAAERRGERIWTNWRLTDLLVQVVSVNKHGLTESDLRSVKNLELLKVKLLAPTAKHHTGRRMPPPVQSKQDQYYGLRMKVAQRLSRADVAQWRDQPPTDAELGEAIKNLTGRSYYRESRH